MGRPIRSSSSAIRLISLGQAKASAVKPRPCKRPQAPAEYARPHCTTCRRRSFDQGPSPTRSIVASVTSLLPPARSVADIRNRETSAGTKERTELLRHTGRRRCGVANWHVSSIGRQLPKTTALQLARGIARQRIDIANLARLLEARQPAAAMALQCRDVGRRARRCHDPRDYARAQGRHPEDPPRRRRRRMDAPNSTASISAG